MVQCLPLRCQSKVKILTLRSALQASEGHDDIDFDDQLMQMSPVTTSFTRPKAPSSNSHQQNRPMNTAALLPGQVKALRGAQEWQESQMIAQPFGDYH